MPLPSQGTTIGMSATEAGTYTTIADVINITPAGGSVPAVDTHNLSSTVKTARAGRVVDPGEVTITIQYDPNAATHQSLTALLVSGAQAVPPWFKITYADGLTTPANDIFQAILTSFEPSELDRDDEDNLLADLTLKLISAVDRNAGAA